MLIQDIDLFSNLKVADLETFESLVQGAGAGNFQNIRELMWPTLLVQIPVSLTILTI